MSATSTRTPRQELFAAMNDLDGKPFWWCRICGQTLSVRSNSARSRHARVHVREGRAVEKTHTVNRSSGEFRYVYRMKP